MFMKSWLKAYSNMLDKIRKMEYSYFKPIEWKYFSLPSSLSFFTCDIKGRYYDK